MPKVTPYQNLQRRALKFAHAVMFPTRIVIAKWPKGVEAIDGIELLHQVQTIQAMGKTPILRAQDGILEIVAQDNPPAPGWEFRP